ncbi:zincin-like metallopeptidase toxin domain-containing protein [Brevibacillus porteri]|uniref:zincin-like metallopeptidase toxin domain-containing protein n=1 Tax=Brevibacillus porteri TaxID=2126350 RepID=UPI00370C72FB
MKGKLDGLGDTLLGLWNVVVDAGDIASTALPTSYLVDAIYEGVTGEERPSLLERNDLARGVVDGATNAVNYVGDTVTGNKSWEQFKSDAKSFGQGLYDDYIDPFVKDAQYDQDNLFKGGLWTRSEDESFAKGQNEFKKDMVVAEVAVSALSAGTGTAVMRTVKLADKLDGPGGRKGLNGGGGKGIGGLLLNTVDDMLDGGASILDGKMKTSAKTLGDKQTEIQELVEKLQMKMKEQSNKEVDDRLDGGMGKIDFVEETARLGGKFYSERDLKLLGKYLEKRGVTLKVGDEFLPPYKGGGFNYYTDELILRSNPTQYEVWHELSHFMQYKKIGKEAYSKLPRPHKPGPVSMDDLTQFNAPEQYVYDMLSNSSKRWNALE